MRVLQVSGPSIGGISRHIDQLQKGLRPQGVDTALASIKVRPGSIASVYKELKRGQYDLVHCHGYQGGAVGRVAASMAGVPAIVTIHNTLQVSGAFNCSARWAETLMQGRTSCWVTVSSFLRNYAWQVLGVPGTKTQVIANGIDIPRELPPLSEKPVVGIVARLVPSKGVDTFLRVIQQLRTEIPDLRAVVVGDGPARGKLEVLSRKLGVEHTVRFMGHCENVSKYLEQMAVFLLPTRSEGLGISVLEAMSMGVPVVATTTGGLPELIANGSTGYLVSPDDYRAMADRVRRILEDRQKAEIFRRAAYRHVLANHSSEAMLEQTLQVYRRVVDA